MIRKDTILDHIPTLSKSCFTIYKSKSTLRYNLLTMDKVLRGFFRWVEIRERNRLDSS